MKFIGQEGKLSNPDKRDKCLHQIFFLLKYKKKISKALNRLNEILHDYRNRYEEIQTVLGWKVAKVAEEKKSKKDKHPEVEVNKDKVKFEIYGEEMIEKTVKLSGNSGRVYLPPNWVGHHVKIIRID